MPTRAASRSRVSSKARDDPAWSSPSPMVRDRPEKNVPVRVENMVGLRDFFFGRDAGAVSPGIPATLTAPARGGLAAAEPGVRPDHRDRLAALGLVAQARQDQADGHRVPGPVGGRLGHQGDDQVVQRPGDLLDLGAGRGAASLRWQCISTTGVAPSNGARPTSIW